MVRLVAKSRNGRPRRCGAPENRCCGPSSPFPGASPQTHSPPSRKGTPFQPKKLNWQHFPTFPSDPARHRGTASVAASRVRAGSRSAPRGPDGEPRSPQGLLSAHLQRLLSLSASALGGAAMPRRWVARVWRALGGCCLPAALRAAASSGSRCWFGVRGISTWRTQAAGIERRRLPIRF